MDKEFYPRDTLEQAIRSWWLVVVLMVLGGAAGLIFSMMHPPLYDAKAVFTTSIDVTRTGQMTDVEVDQAIGIVGDIISSSVVTEQVVQKVKSAGISIDTANFNGMASTDRKNYQWEVHIITSNPNTAMLIANVWADVATSSLDSAYQHALLAQGYQRYLDSLESCLEQTAVNEPAQSICNRSNLANIQLELAKTGSLVKQEKQASQGLLPIMLVSLSNKAELPSKPAVFGRSSKRFLRRIGWRLLLAVWAIYLGLPESVYREKVNDQACLASHALVVVGLLDFAASHHQHAVDRQSCWIGFGGRAIGYRLGSFSTDLVGPVRFETRPVSSASRSPFRICDGGVAGDRPGFLSSNNALQGYQFYQK